MRKIITTMLSALFLVSNTLPVLAAEPIPTKGATVTGNYDEQLTLTTDTDSFFEASIMNPGDVWESEITLKNTSETYNIQVALTDIENVLKDSRLFDVLELEIYAGDDLVYKGGYSKTDSPVFGWIQVDKGESIPLKVITRFPGECGNEYQNLSFKTNWVFETRIDENEIEIINPSKPENEEVETGDNHSTSGYILLGAAAGLVVAFLVFHKKKGDSDDEKES